MTYYMKGITYMKIKVLKICAFVLVAIMLCATLASCSSSRPVKSSKQELEVVGQVGDFSVLYEELRYVVINYKAILEGEYGEGIWDNPETAELHRAELEKLVFDNITVNYAVLSLCSEVGIYHTNEVIQEAVQDYVDNTVAECGGRKAYKDLLREYYLTDNLFRFQIAADYCQNELYYVYTGDLGLIESNSEAIYDYIMDGNFVRTVHVYIENDEGEDVEANRRVAEEVRQRILGGESINSIIGSSFNEDFNLTTTDGYYFTHGEMVEEYENAAFGIEVGGISEVVETYSGFYVIQRLPLEANYVMTNLNTLKHNYQYAELNKYIDEKQTELTFVPNDYCRGLDLVAID